jgi:hypothetical protein
MNGWAQDTQQKQATVLTMDKQRVHVLQNEEYQTQFMPCFGIFGENNCIIKTVLNNYFESNWLLYHWKWFDTQNYPCKLQGHSSFRFPTDHKSVFNWKETAPFNMTSNIEHVEFKSIDDCRHPLQPPAVSHRDCHKHDKPSWTLSVNCVPVLDKGHGSSWRHGL